MEGGFQAVRFEASSERDCPYRRFRSAEAGTGQDGWVYGWMDVGTVWRAAVPERGGGEIKQTQCCNVRRWAGGVTRNIVSSIVVGLWKRYDISRVERACLLIFTPAGGWFL